ncbi:unnamed protein product, partial [Meganyctiphanes norvegica]
ILSSLSHPNITRYYDSFMKAGQFYIQMEYCEGGDLNKYIKEREGAHLSEEWILDSFTQLCSATEYIHGKHIFHRDIKSKNIFLSKNQKKNIIRGFWHLQSI